MTTIYSIHRKPQGMFPPGLQSVSKVHVNVEGGLNPGGWDTSYRINPTDASLLFLLPCIESLYLCGLDGMRECIDDDWKPPLARSSLQHLYLRNGACYTSDYVELLRYAKHLISFV